VETDGDRRDHVPVLRRTDCSRSTPRLPAGSVAGGLAVALALSACLFPSPSAEAGARLFRIENCANCHGPDGRGSPNGPPLVDLGSRWTVDELASFLADPEAFRTADPRLAELSREATNRMTPFAHLSGHQRRSIAVWLLSRERGDG
jgi:mono/diheme cytochrome c family protein